MSSVEELVVRLFRAPSLLVIELDPEATVETVRRACDCCIVTVDDGERVAEAVSKYTFDLVLLDLSVPGAAVALNALRAHCPETPVVVVSGWHDYDDIMTDVTVVSRPLKVETVERLFKLFKIRARTRDVVDYCAGAGTRPQLSGSAG